MEQPEGEEAWIPGFSQLGNRKHKGAKNLVCLKGWGNITRKQPTIQWSNRNRQHGQNSSTTCQDPMVERPFGEWIKIFSCYPQGVKSLWRKFVRFGHSAEFLPGIIFFLGTMVIKGLLNHKILRLYKAIITIKK